MRELLRRVWFLLRQRQLVADLAEEMALNRDLKQRELETQGIGSHYFETLGLRLVRGRTFTRIDGTVGHESAIVNERLVAMVFHGEDPIGRWIDLTNPNLGSAPPLRAQIVGISPTVRQQYLSEIDPVVYLPYGMNPNGAPMLMIRGQADASAITSLLRREVRAIDPDLPVGQVTPLDVLMTQSRWGHRVFGTMFTVFAIVALLISAAGLYAVTAYSVTQRTHEIGVRMALGAEPGHVVWLFVRRGLSSLAIGVALGLGGAFGVGRLMQSMLVQTSPNDPLMLASIATLLAAASIAACCWAARRATRLDPVAALRHE
jgi:putative ABC transport system permease protein